MAEPTAKLPLSGKLIKTVVDNICEAPYRGDDTWPHCSIGVAENSVVATDGRSAIIIGEPAEGHEATQRKEVFVECERGKQYGHPVAFTDVDRNVDKESGEIHTMPHVAAFIRREFDRMKPIAACSPEALLGIAKVAIAAGAKVVDLLQPREGDVGTMGFRFEFPPESGFVNLFNRWEKNIPAEGVFVVTSASAARVTREDGDPEPEAVEAPTREKKRKARDAAAIVIDEAVEALLDAPVCSVDLNGQGQRGDYKLPALAILAAPDEGAADPGDYRRQIESVLRERNLPGRIVGTRPGPTVTLYELEVPARQSSKAYIALADDLQLQLAVPSVRIAAIAGKNALGIEVPNKIARRVGLQEVCAHPEFTEGASRLLVALGQDIGGRTVLADLARMPHLLVAGATNSGKSIGIAAILTSLLLRNSPKDLRLVLIDPKKVELSLFDGIPHLMCPVITDVKEAPGVLRALWREMDRRYDQLKELGVRNIDGYNAKVAESAKLPYIVVVIDELADLMLQARAEVETSIVRLAQLARAVGIHLVVATQRPSVDIVTGLIKANIPSRIAFAVAQRIDSQVILDSPGAERLLSRGDMLFMPIEAGGHATRVQGAFVSEDEVAAVCKHWREIEQPAFELVINEPETGDSDGDSVDPLFNEAVIWIVERGQASTSMLQRKFSIGFQRSSKILDAMESAGVVGPRNGPNARPVLIDGVEALRRFKPVAVMA